VDGSSCAAAPCTYQWTPGSSHSISAPSPQTASGTQYVYASWSDGLGQSHSVAPSAATTYTATFTPVSGGPNLITNYTYDLYDNLSQVSMPRAAGTQTRTFVYSGKYLTSATNPENGTVNYAYTANGKLYTKTDAKGQQIVYTYDAYLRLTQIQRFPTPGNEDVCQRTLFYYDTNPVDGSFSQYAFGRPTATQYGAPVASGNYCPNGLPNTVPYTFTEQYSYTQAGLVTKKRLAVAAHIGNPLTTVNLDTSQTYDNQGRVLTVTYPDNKTYTYAYDGMGRPISLIDNQQNPQTWVNNVQYGLSGELLQINYAGYSETRTYNSRLQLTQVGSMTYTYSSNQNNGQITKQNDSTSGEEVSYTYDTLNRLIGAVTTDSSWGQAFTYDGFGNRTSASVTKGMAPHGSWGYDPATNRLAGSGGYDANGNMLSLPSYGYSGVSYDVENRLVSVPTAYNADNPYQTEQYAYAPGNQRIWRRMSDGTEELYFYGIGGQKLGTYKPFIYNNGGFTVSVIDTNLYFGSRTIVSRGVTVVPDRLGSNRAGGSRYFPYGEEQQVTAQDRDKFATYYRDSTTGLDYAQRRYYASTLGRFTSSDPYMASGQPADPESWNRYAYTRGDPVNRIDSTGRGDCDPNTDDCLTLPDDLEDPTGFINDLFLPSQTPPLRSWDLYLLILDTSLEANAVKATKTANYYYPKWLTVANDTCTLGSMNTGSGVTTAAVRTITYQVLDQTGQPWAYSDGSLTINEIVTLTGGSPVKAGSGNWSTNSPDPTSRITGTGTFDDVLTIGGFPTANPPGTALQGFYAIGNFTTQPLMINYYGSAYGVNSNYYAPGTVLVNNKPAPGGCK
jgi:RHS repeat-associated protein